MFTSCCPAWVKYVEKQRPELLRHLSTCKSPMQMFAALLREYYAKENDGRELYHVAVMPWHRQESGGQTGGVHGQRQTRRRRGAHHH